MTRKLFCEISPLTYEISMHKEILKRDLKDFGSFIHFAKGKSLTPLPYVVYKHKSLIRRKLGNTNMELQENKAVNLSLAAPCVNGILIYPEETFSFWKLVGRPTKSKGYKEGLTISLEKTSSGIGGGMCQFTNLIHWMVLHSPLDIVERHHHDNFDLFPDYGRVVPFGTGTSILYNYLDYRFTNHSKATFQLLVYVDDTYLVGELRCSEPLETSYHIYVSEEYFSKEDDVVYRNNVVNRETINKRTGRIIKDEVLQKNHAKVLYDTTNLVIRDN